ncbi:MAG: bifunctional 4-hydroxy-2-oxoglutarate aldolase/2-dehydro-3-deoxy-phosphogluconate aldolase, partial [Caulobacteraceae bacterium]|nr:bifunctional 4-hydroxy-2-oxoglutarate aldolase/2-dehydro-3-deoxy-phosphogluconate aldolase [Caulobacteraceae bacterium]
MTIDIQALFRKARIMPVVTLSAADQAVPLAHALLEGGLTAIEVTLRTPAGLPGIEAIARHVPQMAVGAGTVLSRADLSAVAEAGATFALSPGSTPDLLIAAKTSSIPFVPGVATASEVMAVLAAGMTTMKLFPASIVGGVPMLRALAGPLGEAMFCPTGGVSLDNAAAYL